MAAPSVPSISTLTPQAVEQRAFEPSLLDPSADIGIQDCDVPANVALSTDENARRILLVDDDPDIRSLVRAFLQAQGYEVFSCGDAHRANSLFRTRDDIDLLLTDLRMPEVDGLELANSLAALRPDLPVLFVSGAVLEDRELQAIQSNGWRFLGKPFLVPELLGAVYDLLEAAPSASKAHQAAAS